jgi:hypothetical protein
MKFSCIQVYVPQNITVPQNTSFFISLINFEGNMLHTLFLWIYIGFSLNGHIKTKNKIPYVWYFFLLMPVKLESLKISLQTNMIYIHQQFFYKRYNIFTIQESHWVIKFTIKSSIFQNYWLVSNICTVLSHNMSHKILVQFNKPFLTYCCTGILWYIRILTTECPI